MKNMKAEIIGRKDESAIIANKLKESMIKAREQIEK